MSSISASGQNTAFSAYRSESTAAANTTKEDAQTDAANYTAKDVLSLSKEALHQLLRPTHLLVIGSEGPVRYDIGDADQTLEFGKYLTAKQNGDTLDLSPESLALFEQIEKNGVSGFEKPTFHVVHVDDADNADKVWPGIMTKAERVAQKDWDENPQNRWAMLPGAEAFAGHDILKTAYPGAPVDDYGYSYIMPGARYIHRPEGIKTATWAYENEKGEMVYLMIDKNGQATDAKGNVVELTGKEGLGTHEPEILAYDRVNLGGLSMEERKTFLDGIQKLLDDNGFPYDSRELTYGTYGSRSSYNISMGDNIPLSIWNKMEELIRNDKTLSALADKSYQYKKQYYPNVLNIPLTSDTFKIKGVDRDGNRVASNQVIIESADGKKQMLMTVDEFNSYDRKQISDLLQRI